MPREGGTIPCLGGTKLESLWTGTSDSHFLGVPYGGNKALKRTISEIKDCIFFWLYDLQSHLLLPASLESFILPKHMFVTREGDEVVVQGGRNAICNLTLMELCACTYSHSYSNFTSLSIDASITAM